MSDFFTKTFGLGTNFLQIRYTERCKKAPYAPRPKAKRLILMRADVSQKAGLDFAFMTSTPKAHSDVEGTATMKTLVLRSGRKPAPKNLVSPRQRPDLRSKLLLILLRDLIPTAIILVFVGWISLQIASYIEKGQAGRQLAPATSTHP